MDTPTQLLAAKIVERLVREGLIAKEAARRLQDQLAAGELKPEDWRLAIQPHKPIEPKP